MKCLFLKCVSVVMIVLFVVGCAGMNDSTRTKAEATGAGVLIGAAIGGGVGYLVGGKGGAAIGAAAGAAIGGVGGYLVGSTVAERKEKYANEEDRLDGEINVVAQYNNDLKKYNEKTAKQNEKLEKQVAYLKSNHKKGNVDENALKKQKAEINLMISNSNKRKEAMNKELAALSKYHQSVANTMDKTKVTQLAKEISILKKNIAILDGNNKQMAKINSSIVSK